MKIHILEMPLDFGGNRHGSDMGPSAIRLAGLKERLSHLDHEAVTSFSPIAINPQEYEDPGRADAKYLKQIVSACNLLAAETEKAVLDGKFPLVLGGDHSIALGTIAGLSGAYRKKQLKLGVLYVDAHGDFNTSETSPSGNIHGMCLSASCGFGIPELTELYRPGVKVLPENVCYVGLRDIDSEEKKLMKRAGVTAFTMSDIDRLGFSAILQKVTSFFKSRVDVVHVSFDMDVIDPMFAPGVGIPLPGGLNYREALLLMEEMAATGMVGSAEIVEVNPVLDVRSQTARMAVELVARLLGDTIY
ncbi:arginase [Treponema brennaborense]|uniref:Arginase n=1 Tax=Treponema brennaborense (strain DSM 12168 / CIP 105900 / DD5/3) TaxID=906968 RepID=F4LMU9_TREBD|nr:arginase [Treponema brennaborense]AEE17839.1 arginase [Treponema brennaborense DSM 12168]